MTDNNYFQIRRTDRLIAIGAGLLALVVYLMTLAPSVSFWDSGEYLTCSWIAGVPHPPGVPLFVLLGRFSTIIFSFLPAIATRVNLLCALAGASTVALLVRLVQRWGGRMGFQPQWYRPMSALAGFIAAFSYSIWRNSNATETYATALLLTFIILWSFDCWIEKYAEKKHVKGRKDHGGWGEARYLLLISYLIILAVANHGSVPLVAGPPILLMYLIYAFKGKTDIWKRTWFILTILGLAVLAFSIHLYMPLRAVQEPEVNETDASHWENFEKAFTRDQYGRTSILERKGPFLDQMRLYLEYLSWQSGRVVDGWDRFLGTSAGAAASMVMKILLIFGAIYGLVVLGIRRPKLLLYLGFLFLMSSILFIFFILNFKTGPEGTPGGEVRERDYFFGASFALFAILSGIGLVSVFKDFLSKKPRMAWLLLIIPAISLAVNYYRCDRSDSYFARDYGINLLESCPENAVLITNGDNDTFPLWFAQGVLGVRRDVIVSNLSLMNTNWYVQQLIDRDSLLLDYDDFGLVDELHPVYIWGPHYFHVDQYGTAETSPVDGQILRATFGQSWPWAVTSGTMAVAMPTEGASNQGVLTMQDLVLINMIKNRPIHGREIYFAGTVATESRQYLAAYQEMEGITFRITHRPVVDAVNSRRGWELMEQYSFTGVTDPSVYKCDQAVQLLKNYVSSYHKLAYHYLASNQPDSVRYALDSARVLFSTLPGDWAEVLPSRAVLIGKLVDGLHGPQAASDTLLYLADQAMDAARMTGDQQLLGMAMSVASMARGSENSFGYLQKLDYRNLITSLSDGSPGYRWMDIEVSLIFGDKLGAWRKLEGLTASSANDPEMESFARLAGTSLEEEVQNSTMSDRMNPVDTGLSIMIEFLDPASASELRPREGTGAYEIMDRMIILGSRGHLTSAVAAGLVFSDKMPDPLEGSMIRMLAVNILNAPEDENLRWFRWFISQRNSASPHQLAYMAAQGGRSDMMYAALAQDPEIPAVVMDAILEDPEGYISAMPSAGSGTGAYSWVSELDGE